MGANKEPMVEKKELCGPSYQRHTMFVENSNAALPLPDKLSTEYVAI